VEGICSLAKEEVEKVTTKKRKLTLAAALKEALGDDPVIGVREFAKLVREIPMLEDQVRRKRNEWMEARDARLRAQWFRRGWMAREKEEK
jgi:hypothetical protein